MCEWTHGHWQGLCNRTSVGEKEMANSGGVMIGVWGWASSPGSVGEKLSPWSPSSEAGSCVATGTARCLYTPKGLPIPHPSAKSLACTFWVSCLAPPHSRMGIPFTGQHRKKSLLMEVLCGFLPGCECPCKTEGQGWLADSINRLRAFLRHREGRVKPGKCQPAD